MKKCLIFIIGLLYLTSSRAQETSRDTSVLSLTFTPTSIIGFNPTLRAGVEYWFQPALRAELEGGWLFGDNWIGQDQRGARVIGSFKVGKVGQLNFIMNADYRRIVQDRFGYVEQMGGAFFTAEDRTVVRSRIGGSLGVGKHYYFKESGIGTEWSIVIGFANLNNQNFVVENGNSLLRSSSNEINGFIDFVFKFKFPVKRWP